jgi:type III secretory pathway lipoprotein EscJ
VLIAYRGANPPLTTADVQRLVAGAVPGLVSEQVSVVMTALPAPPKPADRELARFGPITVTRSSMLPLRALVIGAALLNLILIGLLFALWTRVRRAHGALAEARAAMDAQKSR